MQQHCTLVCKAEFIIRNLCITFIHFKNCTVIFTRGRNTQMCLEPMIPPNVTQTEKKKGGGAQFITEAWMTDLLHVYSKQSVWQKEILTWGVQRKQCRVLKLTKWANGCWQHFGVLLISCTKNGLANYTSWAIELSFYVHIYNQRVVSHSVVMLGLLSLLLENVHTMQLN